MQFILPCIIAIYVRTHYDTKTSLNKSPGLVVMGGDSCSKGCEFEFRHCLLDGHFHIYLL